VNATCADKTAFITSRYPGEACDAVNTCATGVCTSGTCPGAKSAAVCNTTLDCVSGTFCVASSKVCAAQLKEGDACVATWDCANNLGCYSSKCVQWGTQDLGADLNVTTNYLNATLNQGFNQISMFCKSGQSNAALQCSETDYAGSTAIDVKTGFANCSLGDKCTYFDGKTIYDVPCQCGYNAAGQGYCPLATALKSNPKSDLFKKAFAKSVLKFKNDYHSQNRFSCWDVKTSILDDIRTATHQTANAHLFVDAVKCASDVLGSAYINMSIALLSVIVAFLF